MGAVATLSANKHLFQGISGTGAVGPVHPLQLNKTCLRFAPVYGAKAGNVVEKEHLNMG
jgi:hypothetical protein